MQVAGISKNFLVGTGATYSVLISCSRAFPPPNLYHFGCYRKNNYKKIHLSTSLLLEWTNIFPPVSGSPWVSNSLIGKRSFLPLKSCSYCSLIEDALKLCLGGKLTIFTSHQVKQLLNGRGHLWMSDQRILRYQVVLMENPGLTTSPCEVLNPTQRSLPFHSSIETLAHWTKHWEGFSEDPLTNPEEIWYTDGSSFVLEKEEPDMQ